MTWGASGGPPADPAYPDSTPPDAAFPCQTLEPLGAPIEGVATPAMWSRLAGPLDRAPGELWQVLGLSRRGLPGRWVSIHYGRIALNAHGWERLRARLLDLHPDVALVPLAQGAGERVFDLAERLRARRRARELPERLARALSRGERGLARVRDTDPADLDTPELARGGIDEPTWVEILLPWLASRMRGEGGGRAGRSVAEAVVLEQRQSAELGRRLTARGVVERPSDVAYLTTEERIRAAHGDAALLLERVNERRERVEQFVDVQLPARFWGRPRVELKENR